MTDKEKAKAYDEALERAKSFKTPELHDVAEYIFPELAESEDKRIRKEIIKYLEQTVPHHHRDEVLKSKEWIAWLEKQANHANFCNKIQIGDKVTRNRDGVLVNLSQLNRVAKKDEKQSEQKPADEVETITQSYITPNSEFFQWIYDRLIYVHHENPDVDYMHSLKERIEDMQKPSWSEKDEKEYKYVLKFVDNILNNCGNKKDYEHCKRCYDWLKSLKERCAWKPSIAQLNALSIVSKGNAPDDIEAIVSLYNDLKKLKGE